MKKLGINTAAGILDIINTILVATSWFVIGFAAIGEAGGAKGATSGAATFYYIFVGVGLILHIIGLLKSRKAGISITGHILGIIGTGIFLLSPALALGTFVLLIIAAVFTLKQSPVASK
ncbi:hypothetical protein [Loigolactobacillus coryniformis]|uniref:hypothetical protein n=1 Tax=Loigolactobacillus coryniformis TaxID=1610 RepID=UPI000219547D|nr:hypothetical protein [Loigolactobacillus coryniformis]KRK85483.1 hypothetical protein FC16_GL001437 [Loigolactobacillus coryniformis subsp. torquens DSM 20004 = KCTC 3535]